LGAAGGPPTLNTGKATQTRCPQCGTVFRVQPEQLTAARGKVRCGACQAVFDACAAHLDGAPAQASDAPRHNRTPVDAPAAAAPARPRSTVGWTVVNLALMVLLAGQYAYHHRERFAAQPALRPGIELLCAVARCELPPWRDLAALEITTRNVQSHPVLADALLVAATFVNHGFAAQPYPDLIVTFLDTEERPIASRRFTPGEYLPKAPSGPLHAGAEAQAVLEIMDPGARAFGYEFTFR